MPGSFTICLFQIEFLFTSYSFGLKQLLDCVGNAAHGKDIDVVIFTPIQLFGEALTASLNEFDDVNVQTTCCSPSRIVECVVDYDPDLVLYDVTGQQALAEARAVAEACPQLLMIAIAVPEIPKEVIACADAGFAAYIPRRASMDELCKLIHMTLRGEANCHPKVVASLMRELRHRRHTEEPGPSEPLTKRETEVLRLAGRGMSNKGDSPSTQPERLNGQNPHAQPVRQAPCPRQRRSHRPSPPRTLAAIFSLNTYY